MKVITLKRTNVGMSVLGLSVLWIATVLLAATAVRADIYSWQDEQGVIHYSNNNVPPQANLYMKVPKDTSPPPDTEIHKRSERIEPDIEAIRQQAKAEVRIEEANRKLDRALDKVDELTEKVEESRARARAAEQAANEAAAAAESQAASSGYYGNGVKERVIVHSTPYYPYRYKNHGPHYNKPYYFGPKKYRHGYKNGSGLSKHHYKYKHDRKYKRGRHHLHRSKPIPIIRERSRIPKAYGIR